MTRLDSEFRLYSYWQWHFIWGSLYSECNALTHCETVSEPPPIGTLLVSICSLIWNIVPLHWSSFGDGTLARSQSPNQECINWSKWLRSWQVRGPWSFSKEIFHKWHNYRIRLFKMELNLNAAQKLSDSENASCEKILEVCIFSQSKVFGEISLKKLPPAMDFHILNFGHFLLIIFTLCKFPFILCPVGGYM